MARRHRWAEDGERVGHVCRQGRELLARLPAKSRRNAAEKIAGHALVHLLADAVWRFFRAHRKPIYDTLTAGTQRAPCAWTNWHGRRRPAAGHHADPGRTGRESQSMQMDKDGLEIHQGLFFGQLLSDRDIGLHLCTAMLMPTAAGRWSAWRNSSARASSIWARCAWRRRATRDTCISTIRATSTPRTTIRSAPQEIACDLILLHPGLRMGVLRGAPVEHPKYKGRRIFSAGINLTRIYQGKQSYLFYLTRDMGFLNKMLSRPRRRPIRAGALELHPDEPEQTLEKPWLAVVDSFAIGGGCQLLLVVDYVIAESGAYFNLPARKEGIIPGCANLRLPRFMGERLAREAIMFDKTFHVDDADARTLVNEVLRASAWTRPWRSASRTR